MKVIPARSDDGTPDAESVGGLRRRAVGYLFGVAIAGIITVMGLLGLYITNAYREAQIAGLAHAGSLYIEGFMAPYAHAFVADGEIPPNTREELVSEIARMPTAQRFQLLNIWGPDGKLILSTGDDEVDRDLSWIEAALAGTVSTELYTDGSEGGTPASVPLPFLEIHAPISDPDTGRPVAVGELYLDARDLLDDRTSLERAVWTSILLSTLALLGLLVMVSAQRRELLRVVDIERQVARQNRSLRFAAEDAQRQAGKSNERLLNAVGAEIHDGPVQMLSLARLMSNEPAKPASGPSAPSVHSLVGRALEELRAISSGLILPEIRDLDLDETLRLAVSQHEDLTGTPVTATFGPLPDRIDDGRKVCLFRVVQEGLNNAERHGKGQGLAVNAHVEDGALEICVQDEGPGEIALDANTDRRGLGLQGMRQRLAAYGGSVTLGPREGGGAELRASLPLPKRPPDAQDLP